AEKLRRIPPESIDDLRKAGLLRTLQPAVLGGYELPLDEAVLITATVAEGCGSTGWVQGIYTDADLKAGLLRTLQRAVLGGYELPLDEAVLITATVAEGCGSTGWVQGIYTDHCATLGMFDGQAQKDVWGASPDSLISSGFMPT